MDNNDAQFVGSIPDFYDRGLGPVIFADYARLMAERVAAYAPARVLETAAGTGIVTRALRDHLPRSSTLIATDLNAPMLDIARSKFAAGDVEFRTADAQALDFPDAGFDAMVCQFGIMFYPDKPKSHREALRVLKPGGRYHFSVWDAHSSNSFARITDGLIKHYFPTDPPGFYRVPFSSAPIDPLKHDLLGAGFTDLKIEIIHLDVPVADLALFTRGLVFGNPLIDQIRARRGVTPDELQAALLEALKAEFGAPPVASLQTIFYEARRPA